MRISLVMAILFWCWGFSTRSLYAKAAKSYPDICYDYMEKDKCVKDPYCYWQAVFCFPYAVGDYLHPRHPENPLNIKNRGKGDMDGYRVPLKNHLKKP